MTNVIEDPYSAAVDQLYDVLWEQIEAGDLDEVEEKTFKGGPDAYERASASATDAHHEATVQAVLKALAAKLVDRANGRLPRP